MVVSGAWLPAEDARRFVERHGFAHFRYWWNMGRPIGPVPEPAWPEGIELRTFDGTDHALEEWTACYNEAFASGFPSHLATVEEGRQLAAGPLFRADGLLLAWRGTRCVGFCRDTIFPGHGEVDVLGVRPDAQGQGLGRALLRWGVAWLQEQRAPHVRLIVDGTNENALGLYRSEGFGIAATREMWARPASVTSRG
jgi:mycothiol synthase